MKILRKTFAIAMILVTLFSIFFTPTFDSAREYLVADNSSGELFSVAVNNSEITISTKDDDATFFIDCEIAGICCFDKVFTFLCLSKRAANDYVYTVYIYNFTTGHLASFATDCKASRSNIVFSADSTGNFYLLSFDDSTLLHYYENGVKVMDIKCHSNITQMICIDTRSVLLFTVDGVYLLKDTALEKLSSLVPVTPCVYTGNGIFVDNMGIKFIYKENSFDIYQEETESVINPSEQGNVQIDHSQKYILISADTTVAMLLDTLGLEESKITIEKADGEAVASGKLGTGMTVLADGTRYSVAVKGDLTGEGNLNSRDLDAMMRHLTKENFLADIFAIAADLDNDNAITTKDLLALSRLY
ncbi:MAG: dockerin type I repeat-containing protein [Ruminococcus sp.]|nr:dockerin type I repeat-containing protein [Ruminococcus sp.]